jgi:hypothetical protein
MLRNFTQNGVERIGPSLRRRLEELASESLQF